MKSLMMVFSLLIACQGMSVSYYCIFLFPGWMIFFLIQTAIDILCIYEVYNAAFFIVHVIEK